MVVGRTGAAPAATGAEVARAAGAAVLARAQALEHRARLPNLVEGLLTHVAGLLGHIGARAHDTLGAHDAVRETRQAAALETRLDAQLLGHARELRGARGLDVDGNLGLLGHDLTQQALVGRDFERRVVDVLAAPHRDEEEDVVRDGTVLNGEVGDVAHLVLVPVEHRGVNLERQAHLAASAHAGHRGVPRALEAAERIVLGAVEAVEADAHGAGAALLEAAGHFGRDEGAVGAEHRAQALARRIGHEVVNVGAHERLAAREDHDLETGSGDLVDKRAGLVGRELVGARVGARVLVAMLAGEVALVGGHPGHDHDSLLPTCLGGTR